MSGPVEQLGVRDLVALVALHASLSSGIPGQHQSPPQASREAYQHADAFLECLKAERAKGGAR